MMKSYSQSSFLEERVQSVEEDEFDCIPLEYSNIEDIESRASNFNIDSAQIAPIIRQIRRFSCLQSELDIFPHDQYSKAEQLELINQLQLCFCISKRSSANSMKLSSTVAFKEQTGIDVFLKSQIKTAQSEFRIGLKHYLNSPFISNQKLLPIWFMSAQFSIHNTELVIGSMKPVAFFGLIGGTPAFISSSTQFPHSKHQISMHSNLAYHQSLNGLGINIRKNKFSVLMQSGLQELDLKPKFNKATSFDDFTRYQAFKPIDSQNIRFRNSGHILHNSISAQIQVNHSTISSILKHSTALYQWQLIEQQYLLGVSYQKEWTNNFSTHCSSSIIQNQLSAARLSLKYKPFAFQTIQLNGYHYGEQSEFIPSGIDYSGKAKGVNGLSATVSSELFHSMTFQYLFLFEQVTNPKATSLALERRSRQFLSININRQTKVSIYQNRNFKFHNLEGILSILPEELKGLDIQFSTDPYQTDFKVQSISKFRRHSEGGKGICQALRISQLIRMDNSELKWNSQISAVHSTSNSTRFFLYESSLPEQFAFASLTGKQIRLANSIRIKHSNIQLGVQFKQYWKKSQYWKEARVLIKYRY